MVSTGWKVERARLLSALVLFSLLMPFSAGTAAAMDPWWVNVDNSRMPFTLTESRSVLLQGQKGATGRCQATLTLTKPADARPITAVEVAYNEETCQQLIEIGTAVPDPRSVLGGPDSISTTSAEIPAFSATSPTWLQKWGYYYTYWHDPAWLVVNSDSAEMRWNYSSPFIMEIVAAWDDLNWLSASGWYLNWHPAPILTVDYNDYWATLESKASFYNTAFCGGTGTTYQPNKLKAYGDGHDSGSVNTWDWGCRSDWLHFASTLY